MDKKRLHLGCGPVYLDNYINIDVKCAGHYLSKDRPDLVLANKTTIDKYYTKDITQKNIESKQYQKEECVCDMYADVQDLPFENGSIDEIRSYQLFEHFTFREAGLLLDHWRAKLKENGLLFIDIPDLDGTIKLYNEAETMDAQKWAIRLLYGSQKNKWGSHKAMYNRSTIRELLEDHGFYNIKFGDNIHFYPGFSVEAIK